MVDALSYGLSFSQVNVVQAGNNSLCPLFFLVLVVKVGGSAVVVLRVRVRYSGRSTGQKNQGRVSKELKASM